MESNLSKGDKEFVAIYGYTYEVPGVENKAIIKEYGMRPIEGTSDVVEGQEHKHLIDLARTYAKAYNQKLLKILKKETDAK